MRLLKDRLSVTLLALAWLSFLWAPCYADSPFDGLKNVVASFMNNFKTKPPVTTVPATQPEEFWRERHQLNIDRAKQGREKIGLLFLGDSITQNMDGSQDLLDKNWGKYSPTNLGIGGDHTEHLIYRLQHGEVDGLNPKVAVILIGTNNLWVNSDADIIEGLRAVISTARQKMPHTKLLVLGILPRWEKPDHADRARITNINKEIAKLVDTRHVWYFDAGPSLVEADGTISDRVMPDFLHPSHKGYDMLFTAIKPQVDQLLK